MTTLRVDFNQRYGDADTVYYELQAEKPVFNVQDGVVTVGSMSGVELVLPIGAFTSAFVTSERPEVEDDSPEEGPQESEDSVDYEIPVAYAVPNDDSKVTVINVYGGSSAEDVAKAVKQYQQDGLW